VWTRWTRSACRSHRSLSYGDAQEKAGRPNPLGLVFPSATGTVLQASNWNKNVWAAWKEQAGLDPKTTFKPLTRKVHHSPLVMLGVEVETLRCVGSPLSVFSGGTVRGKVSNRVSGPTVFAVSRPPDQEEPTTGIEPATCCLQTGGGTSTGVFLSLPRIWSADGGVHRCS